MIINKLKIELIVKQTAEIRGMQESLRYLGDNGRRNGSGISDEQDVVAGVNFPFFMFTEK